MFWTDVRRRVLRAVSADRDVMLYAARVSVWARWLVWVIAVANLAYRPQLWWPTDKQYLLLNVPLVAFNGLVHWRLRRGRRVSWGWLLFLSGMDVALISAAVVIGGEFHLFSYVAYYPALALFAGRVSFPVARRGLDDAGRRGLCRGQREGGTRSRLRCRPGEGPARQDHGDVRSRRDRQPHRPLRTG